MKRILLLILLSLGIAVQAQEDHTSKVRLLDVSEGTKADSILTYSPKKEIRYLKTSALVGGKVNKGGDTMTGALLLETPVDSIEVSTNKSVINKEYGYKHFVSKNTNSEITSRKSITNTNTNDYGFDFVNNSSSNSLLTSINSSSGNLNYLINSGAGVLNFSNNSSNGFVDYIINSGTGTVTKVNSTLLSVGAAYSLVKEVSAGVYEEKFKIDHEGNTTTQKLTIEGVSEDLTADKLAVIDAIGEVKYIDKNLTSVDITSYGAIGDGLTDNKTAFINALGVSKLNGKPLYIPSGDFLIVHNDTEPIIMTDCSGIIGEGTLIFDVPASDNPTLYWEGERELVSDSINFVKGEKQADIFKNKDVNIGDTFFLISTTSQITDNQTKYYNNAQRLTVVLKEDNGLTDKLTFQENFEGYQGYLVWNKKRPLIKLSGVTFISKNPTVRKGLEFTTSEVVIEDVNVYDFQLFNVNISSSYARINRLKAMSKMYVGSVTSYGLQVSGLSKVVTRFSKLEGGRHGITHGDVGYWNADFFGLPSENYFLSSTHSIYNSSINSNSVEAALDSHRNTKFLKVVDCDIYNGVVIGGLESYIIRSNITTGVRGDAITNGRGATDASIPYGKVSIKDCDVYAENYIFNNGASLDNLIVDDLEISNSGSVLDIFFNRTISGNEVINVNQVYKNISFKDLGVAFNSFNLLKKGDLKIDGFLGGNIGISIAVKEQNSKPININKVDILGAERSLLVASLGETNVNLNNVIVKNSDKEGLYFLNATTSLMKVNNCSVNNAGGIGVRVKGDGYYFNMQGSESTNNGSRGIFLQQDNSGTSFYSLNGVLSENNTLSNVDLETGLTNKPLIN